MKGERGTDNTSSRCDQETTVLVNVHTTSNVFSYFEYCKIYGKKMY
jgi:hypothetical protein